MFTKRVTRKLIQACKKAVANMPHGLDMLEQAQWEIVQGESIDSKLGVTGSRFVIRELRKGVL